MQPDNVYLWYVKLRFFDLTDFKVWNSSRVQQKTKKIFKITAFKTDAKTVLKFGFTNVYVSEWDKVNDLSSIKSFFVWLSLCLFFGCPIITLKPLGPIFDSNFDKGTLMEPQECL